MRGTAEPVASAVARVAARAAEMIIFFAESCRERGSSSAAERKGSLKGGAPLFLFGDWSEPVLSDASAFESSGERIIHALRICTPGNYTFGPSRTS